MRNKPLVSVILIAENSDVNDILKTAQNIFDQTYGEDNIDLIVSYMGDTNDLKEKLSPLSFNIQYSASPAGIEMFDHALKMVRGDYVFYKSINNVLWFPRHIEVHVGEFQNHPKTSWALSHLEYRDVNHPEHPLNTIAYRIESPPQLSKICLDEICHLSSVDANWNNCVIQEEGKDPLFLAGLITREWNDKNLFARIPEEITVVQWINPKRDIAGGQTFQEIATQLGVPKQTEVKEDIVETEDGIEVVRQIPTVMGNAYIDQYSNSIRQVISNTESITDIGIKRTIGMGDIIVVEPIIRKLKQKHPNSKITLYTAKPDIVKYFETEPDEVVQIGEDQLLQDYLADTNHQVKYDLDLSYESRLGKSFLDSYAEVCDCKFDDAKDRIARLSLKNVTEPQLRPDKKFVVVVADGSGWIGKTWGSEKYREVIKYLQSKDYEVVECGYTDFSGLTNEDYNACELNDMVWYMANCEFYIGGDNGPMHISRGFEKPAVIVAGAALPYYTNPNREKIFYVQNEKLDCLGCKHRQFFHLTDQGGITFMAQCDNNDKGVCMKSIEPSFVIDAIEKITTKQKTFLGTDAEFSFNIPQCSYYLDIENDLYVKDDVEHHPDQETDISKEYDFRWEEIYEKYSKPFVDEIKVRISPLLVLEEFKKHNAEAFENNEFDPSKITEELNNPISPRKSFLDVGCNMGMVVKAALDAGFDSYGCDINIPSVEKAWKQFPELLERVNTPDKIPDQQWDIICMNQTLEHIENPIEFLKYWSEKLSLNGKMFIGVPSLDEKDAKIKLQRFQTIGIGEHSWMPTNKSFDVIMKKVGLEYEHLQDTKKGIFVKVWKK